MEVFCGYCKKKIKRNACNVKKTKSSFCNNKCQVAKRKLEYIPNNIELLKQGKLKVRQRIKKTMLYMGIPNYCSTCKLSIWRGKPLTMILDHIDGNAANNLLTNFRFLCPNCESQSEHYKGRNYGNGRKSLGLL